jgi:hypothetical protein
MKSWISSMVYFLLSLVFIYFYVILFYPRQSMAIGTRINIETPNPEKYKNDCLHPCIRFIPAGFLGHHWWMVQSPYYGRNSALENPILYYSEDMEAPTNWKPLAIVSDTPSKGYNSDPNLYFEDGKLWIFWRECYTPLCDSIGALMATVGVWTVDGINFSKPQVFLTHKVALQDTEQSPILIKRDNVYLFYAVHYQYKPERKSLGIAIWQSTSIDSPDFHLRETVKVPVTFTVDKYKQKKLWGKLFFIPKPLKHDIWHFDLFEHNKKLYMLSVAEWGDNVMLSVSDDYKNFITQRLPLLNTHVSQQFSFYKPTGFIKNNILYLYYTAMGKIDKKQNELYFTKVKF